MTSTVDLTSPEPLFKTVRNADFEVRLDGLLRANLVITFSEALAAKGRTRY